MKKKVLITGACGFIGGHLANKLLERDDLELYLVDNLQRGRHDEFMQKIFDHPQTQFIQADLTDRDSLKKLPAKIDQIYHLAAVVGVKHCMGDPARVLRTNLLSAINIVDYAKQNQGCRLLFSSTCENYAGGFELGIIPIPTSEDVPLSIADIKNPRWSYAGSKIVGEQMVMFNAPNFYDYCIVRYHNIFGPRMGYAHVIPEVLKRLRQNEDPFRLIGPHQTRAFCYIQDAIEQTILCMEHPQTKNETIHIGNSIEEITIGDLIQKIFEITGKNPATIVVEAPGASVNRRCPDTSKIKKLTNFFPRTPLDLALKETVDWYSQEIDDGRIWE